ncbi:SDR family NAD(P)-dependent oxidoreductase [Sphingomonas canadensis]|uniref:SDR family NAD(P)-dependent oxidoreductase n=1 Tax=Sphingomonas canadensis TaxID=1219257 RepID=A0ABW3HBW7_9SPHN|nr:SDR family NAD(P)-dependent oxidoreductase [Sphingomonas canadensis]MCW3838314.1 SDR family NAD(P)-dependent oxidoreductase [Sphingomonas canadensis]
MREDAKTWFITGCATGFGRALAMLALERGDRVAVTDRDRAAVAEWEERYPGTALALQLDVTRPDEVAAAADAAFARFGRIDLLVNNAGYGLQAAVEEAGEDQIRRLFEVNLFGMIDVIRAFVPRLRDQGGGHVINFSSVGGRVTAPLLALYAASKFAVEGLTLGLSHELAGFGIKVTAVEPGAFATRFGTSAAMAGQQHPAYASIRQGMEAMIKHLPQGEPETLAAAILELADAPEPPVQFIGGGDAYVMIEAELERQQAEMRKWKALSEAANSLVRERA